MVNFLEGIYDLSWPLKMKNIMFWYFFFFKFFQFYFRHGLHIASGPQKGALFVGIIGGKMVLHCTGGHNISSNVPLNDVPF